MDLLQHLRWQLSYDAWANADVLSAIKASKGKSDPAQPLKFLAHVLSAERLWLERLGGQAQSLPVWPEFTIEQCAANIAELAELWDKYIAQLSSAALSDLVTYKNSKGEMWTSSVLDVLTHVVMHSAYHRGQIASVMRAGGGTPAYTDFIHAARQGLIEPL